ncbi:hypothetical protein THASP1DRAFT_30092 [Thamnocephalis sphaerospora]|uniref:Uncharacterized protein n=1 Tax=Thamnocephalis sphaerospora TaxID=78915 RepID=A0A4P9XQ01_9FUNG|nr:hypothetical protein THASP1DRAFT_30092 [Thamnocephalis sphaerospora]|eukprot:RKP08105.1 hypothetical protein THASP1DRAFT_30092 [Thamnocephalis sphaerospora]
MRVELLFAVVATVYLGRVEAAAITTAGSVVPNVRFIPANVHTKARLADVPLPALGATSGSYARHRRSPWQRILKTDLVPADASSIQLVARAAGDTSSSKDSKVGSTPYGATPGAPYSKEMVNNSPSPRDFPISDYAEDPTSTSTEEEGEEASASPTAEDYPPVSKTSTSTSLEDDATPTAEDYLPEMKTLSRKSTSTESTPTSTSTTSSEDGATPTSDSSDDEGDYYGPKDGELTYTATPTSDTKTESKTSATLTSSSSQTSSSEVSTPTPTATTPSTSTTSSAPATGTQQAYIDATGQTAYAPASSVHPPSTCDANASAPAASASADSPSAYSGLNALGAAYSQCAQTHLTCYRTCGIKKMYCDDMLRKCARKACDAAQQAQTAFTSCEMDWEWTGNQPLQLRLGSAPELGCVAFAREQAQCKDNCQQFIDCPRSAGYCASGSAGAEGPSGAISHASGITITLPITMVVQPVVSTNYAYATPTTTATASITIATVIDAASPSASVHYLADSGAYKSTTSTASESSSTPSPTPTVSTPSASATTPAAPSATTTTSEDSVASPPPSPTLPSYLTASSTTASTPLSPSSSPSPDTAKPSSEKSESTSKAKDNEKASLVVEKAEHEAKSTPSDASTPDDGGKSVSDDILVVPLHDDTYDSNIWEEAGVDKSVLIPATDL